MLKISLTFTLLISFSVLMAQSTKFKPDVNVGIGVGNIRDKIAPSGNLLVYLQKTTSSERTLQLGLWWKTTFLYDEVEGEELEVNKNSFLSAFYSLSTKSTRIHGIGIGYLVRREGDAFTEDTFSLSYHLKSINSGYTVTPEIILTDQFNEAIPTLSFTVLF